MAFLMIPETKVMASSECRGRGIEIVLVKDTRTLTGKAAKLYAGATSGKDGIKALAKNQLAALQDLGRYRGLFKDRQEISGPGCGPVAILGITPADLSDEALAQIAAGGVAQSGI